MSNKRLCSMRVAVGLAVWSVALWGCGSSTPVAGPDTPGAGTSRFVGSTACRPCHETQYREEHDFSGHMYKLVKVNEGQPPEFALNALRGPYKAQSQPPAGLSWSDIAYVIGGYGWKSRYVDNNGYVVTGDGVQWNMRTRRWVGYQPSVPRGGLAYDFACFQCHTTGARDGTDDLSTHQDGRPGMKGTFSEPGIGCEACHGPGREHVERPSKGNIVLNAGTGPRGTTPTRRRIINENDDGPAIFLGPPATATRATDWQEAVTCGDCHTRKGVGQIAAKGGFVEHHEQFEELMASGPHRLLDCTTCHDPHRGTIYHNTGIVRDCASCHGVKRVNHAPGATCLDCHMPFSGKSGDATSPYSSDVRSHIFRVRTTPEPKAAMFNAEGTLVALDQGGNARLTLDFACYGCHKDEAGEGGSGSIKTLAELALKADGIHD